MKCLNKKDMKAWQLNRRHCIWNRTGIRHVYIESSALCAIEFLRSSRSSTWRTGTCAKDPPSAHWAHTVVGRLIDIFSCIHLWEEERRHLERGKRGNITRRQTCAGPGKRSCYASPDIFFPDSKMCTNSEGPNGTYSLTSLQAQLKLTPTIC